MTTRTTPDTRSSWTTRWATFGLLATLAASALSPAALADSRQKNKNNWRNLAGVAAAVAGYGLLKGNKTATLLGAAGGAYSASRYEKDRHSQSQTQGYRNRSFYRGGNGQSYGNGYRGYNSGQSYGNGYNSNGYRGGSSQGGSQWSRRGNNGNDEQGDNERGHQGRGHQGHGHQGHGHQGHGHQGHGDRRHGGEDNGD